jgi:hypothetical protein
MEQERAVYESYSRAEITRRDIERLLNAELSFSDVFLKLCVFDLPLPRFPRNEEHVNLIRDLALRANNAA